MFYLELSVDADKKLLELMDYFEINLNLTLDRRDLILYLLDSTHNNLIEEQEDV